jgi:hypothetical protein
VLNTLSGRHVVSYLGGQGIRWNYPRNQSYSAFGYPQASPFNGLYQYRCNSGVTSDDNPGGSGPTAHGILCNMTGGSSGGGWLINLSGGLGYVNGHNDYKYNSDPGHMFSPYYGNEAATVYNTASAA